MKSLSKASVLAGAVLVLSAGVVLSQDKPGPEKPGATVKLADFAPKWKLGDWWVVETYTRDLKAAITGMPEVEKPELPGFPPLRGGVPKGFKRHAKFRFEVKKLDAKLSKPDKDEAEGEAESYIEVAVASIGAVPARSATILYAASDLAIGEIRYQIGGGKEQQVKVYGTAVVDQPASLGLGFPFDWPDWAQAMKAEAQVKVKDQRILQKHVFKEKEKLHLLFLTEESKAKSKYRVIQRWAPGRPFWNFLDGPAVKGRLIDWKKDGK